MKNEYFGYIVFWVMLYVLDALLNVKVSEINHIHL
jgi:hypothetical protein